MSDKKDILILSYEELQEEMQAMGEKAFRSAQIYQWLHQKRVDSFEKMSNLSKGLREKLEENFRLQTIQAVEVLTSKIDGTMKFLFALEDGNVVESVLMKYHHGNSVCISTQVGCRMGCKFCASTLDGLERNLTASEMLLEIYEIQRISGERISNIVLMGSGEPLDNYEQVMRFIKLVTDERGLNISNRNITLSTCGLVPEIYRLADEKKQITLAISLHAPDDEKRQELMPIARKYSIDEILKACHYYFEKTGRRISFEYSLVAGINDNLEEAKKLAERLKGFSCHVNLIPVNPIKERNFSRSDRSAVEAFQRYLEKKGINATIRREMGSDINGACGQLRKSYRDKIHTEEGDS